MLIGAAILLVFACTMSALGTNSTRASSGKSAAVKTSTTTPTSSIAPWVADKTDFLKWHKQFRIVGNAENLYKQILQLAGTKQTWKVPGIREVGRPYTTLVTIPPRFFAEIASTAAAKHRAQRHATEEKKRKISRADKDKVIKQAGKSTGKI